MTPLVLVPTGPNTSGLQLSKLPAGGPISLSTALGVDALGNVVLSGYQSLVLDMGSRPVNSARVQISVPGATLGMNVVCSISGDSPIGGTIDELEMEPLLVFGSVTAVDLVTFFIICALPYGLTIGQKEINYYVG